jgi:NAD(P)-dependent dehydrogenase (short-subunit alcohol dehydrogenase family)
VVILLRKALARELGPHDVNVNCIAPGSFLTAMTASNRTPEEQTQHSEHRKKACVLGRLGTLEELASSVLFLASDEASFITGQTLSVDGGRFDRM